MLSTQGRKSGISAIVNLPQIKPFNPLKLAMFWQKEIFENTAYKINSKISEALLVAELKEA